MLLKGSLCIMGILLDKRIETAPAVQDVLTRHGDMILSRVGMHDPDEKEHGLISLFVRDKPEGIDRLEKELEAVDGVRVKTMVMKQ